MPEDSARTELLGVKVTPKEMLIIESHAALNGVTKSTYIRDLLRQAWAGKRLRKYQPYVAIAGQLLLASRQLDKLLAYTSTPDLTRLNIEKTMQNIDTILLSLTDRIAVDQEADLNDNNEEETFE
jgi:hypothetical protein